jgi:hypothetical protein
MSPTARGRKERKRLQEEEKRGRGRREGRE